MTGRGGAVVLMALTALLSGLSTGLTVYYFIALCFALALGLGLFAVLLLRMSLRVRSTVSARKVHRGEHAVLTATLSCGFVLPMSQVYVAASTGETGSCRLRPFRDAVVSFLLPFDHVGMYPCSVSEVEAADLFGLFRLRIRPGDVHPVLSLPQPFPLEKMRFAPGDTGRAALKRTQEDYTSPEDTRAYLPGDAMKRIHWKLSSRKGELLVRRYETPMPPDTLILVDPALPQSANEYVRPFLRDTLCETAVAAADMQLQDESPVRVPFYGDQANEFAADHARNLPLLQEMLALQPFDGVEDFARTLNLEMRRMNRTGAVVVITARLSAYTVEAISRMRRMGPHVRVYLVTLQPDDPALEQPVTQLQHHLVEVCYVTPA